MRVIMIAAGLLAAGTLGAGRPEAPARRTESRLVRIAEEVAEFRETTGELPPTVNGVEGVVSEPELLTDEWGFPIRYIRVAGEHFWLLSLGADGAAGGEGDAADVLHIE